VLPRCQHCSVEFGAKMITTACILHNICIRDPDADNVCMMERDDSEAGAKEDVSYDVAARKHDVIADRLYNKPPQSRPLVDFLSSYYVALTSKSTPTETTGLDSSRGASSYGSVCVRNEADNQGIRQ